MDGRGQLRERGHIVQEGGRRAPAQALAGVHGGGGPAHGGAHPDLVGAARMGRGTGVGAGRDETGRPGRALPVRRHRDGTAPDQGLLRGAVLEDRPEPGRLRGRRDVCRAPGRPAIKRRGPRHRARLQVPDRTVRLGPVPGAAPVEGRHQVSFCFFLPGGSCY